MAWVSNIPGGTITTSTTSGNPWITTSGTTQPVYTYPGPEQYSEHECGIHDLKYKAIRAGCPLCESARDVQNLRATVKKLTNQLQQQHDELRKLQVNWDLLTAMRDAASLLDEDDMAFFKSVLYQWRDEKSVGLKFTYGHDDNQKKSVNGFIVMPRGEDPWGYACTSIGGLAIASYFEEACRARGSAEAMGILTRAFSDHLPGSLDEPGHSAA